MGHHLPQALSPIIGEIKALAKQQPTAQRQLTWRTSTKPVAAAKFVEQPVALRQMSNYMKMATTYLSTEPGSWVPPTPPWFLGVVKNVRRNLPICTSSPLTSIAESTASRLT
jgi:hypothetical protein